MLRTGWGEKTQADASGRCVGLWACLKNLGSPRASRDGGSGDRWGHLDLVQRAVIVAVAVVGVMEMSIDEIVDVISMGDRLVTAAGPVHVRGGMGTAGMSPRALGGIGGRDGDGVLLDDARCGLVMQVAVMEVIDVPLMVHSGVAAAGGVAMAVIGVGVAGGGHERVLSQPVKNGTGGLGTRGRGVIRPGVQ